MKTKVITDSTTCIPKRLMEEKGIDWLDSKLRIKGEELKDLRDFDREEFIEKLSQYSPYPQSTMASPQEALEAFQKAKAEGYEQILYIGVSPTISNQFNSAKVASKKVKGIDVTLYETGLSSSGHGIMAYTAYELLEKGKKVEEIVEIMNEMRKDIHTIGISPSFEALFKTGKIQKNIGLDLISKIMNLKPMFEIPLDEGVQSFGAGMGFRGAIKKAIGRFEELASDSKEYDLILSDAGSKKHLKKIEDKIKEKFNIKNVHYWKTPPVIIWAIGINSIQITLAPHIE